MNKSFSKKITNSDKQLILKYMKTHMVDSKNINIEYFFKTKKYVITIYKNNTMTIQGQEYENILKMLKIKVDGKSNEQTKNNTKKNIVINIGSDESGVGDLFGGISIASVKIPKNNLKEIQKLGVNDSKKLTDAFMKKIYPNIIKLTNVGIKDINATEYNKMYASYKNTNVLKTYGHNIAIKKIYKNNDVVLIDAYANLKNYKKYLDKLNEDLCYELILETKAESKYLEVACASIVARVNFLKQIEKIEKELNMRIPLGANPRDVNNILKKLKDDNKKLSKYIKEHFKNNKE